MAAASHDLIHGLGSEGSFRPASHRVRLPQGRLRSHTSASIGVSPGHLAAPGGPLLRSLESRKINCYYVPVGPPQAIRCRLMSAHVGGSNRGHKPEGRSPEFGGPACDLHVPGSGDRI
jgi:hypothetical protein